jgi:hypothetical protein
MFNKDEQANIMNKAKQPTNANLYEELYLKATEAFLRNAPALTKIETLAVQPTVAAGYRPDRLIRITRQDRHIDYYVEEKAQFIDANRLILLMYREKLDKPIMLIADYINPRQADRLRKDNLEFIDTAGNAFINNLAMYIFVKGNRPDYFLRPQPLDRAFNPAGLKIIFAFLCNPGLENATYRKIAAATGVALGTVNIVMRDLVELGFLLDLGKRGYRLVQKKDLLKQWVTGYAERLRPKLVIGCYKGELGWLREEGWRKWDAQLGGEVAAARWTEYLKPELTTIYTARNNLNQLLFDNKLRKDPQGEVEILERFWKPEAIKAQDDFVHPILVYADLLATGNQRNIDTANLIYEQHILRLVRED